jgi:hypothetical protein
MRYGIAIAENDPGILIKDFIVEANLAKLPLSILAFELQEYNEVAENLGLEKIRLVTLRPKDELSSTIRKLHTILKSGIPDRIYFHLSGSSLSPGPIMEVLTAALEKVDRIGFISPIGEIYKDKSVTREIISLNTRRIEYVPIFTYFPSIPTPLLNMIAKNNGRPITMMVLPLKTRGEKILKWIDETLTPNGVEEVIYPSLFYAKPELFREEIDMVTKKRKPTTKRKPKEILLPPEGEPTAVKVEVLFPLAKRSTPSLNAMVLGSCEIGEQFDLVSIVKVSDTLVFGETKEKFYICLTSNKVDYIRYL